jgi:hypothetical protein
VQTFELLLDNLALTTNNKNYVNSQQFLLLNIAILFFFVLWFLAGRRGSHKKTTQLQMKLGNEAPSGGVLQKTAQTKPTVPENSGRYSHPKFQKYLEDESLKPAAPKELNILFNYNGHTWDAYEVLGVPAGANLVDVTKAYQQMLRSADPESHTFLETAFKTILEKK